MNCKLKFRFRKKQNYKPRDGAYYYTLNANNIAITNSGMDPDPKTAWFEPPQYELSSDAKGGAANIDFRWTLSENTEPDTRGNNYLPKATSEMFITGSTAMWFKEIFEDDPMNALNTVEVEVYDCRFDKYYPIMMVSKEGYTFRNIKDGGCIRQIKIKEIESQWDCFAQTETTNDFQNWFPDEPAHLDMGTPADVVTLQAGDPPYHPRMGYCNEHRPASLMAWILTIYLIIYTVINSINAIITFINDLASFVGYSGTLIDPIPFNADDNLLGCGRVHTAVKIRHLFKNVCDYCELEYDDDIFNTPELHPLFADEIPADYPAIGNEYYEAMVYAPIYSRGWRMHRDRFKHFDANNWPILTGYDLAEHLRKPFNLKWKIKNGKLKIRNRHFYEPSIVFDFTAPGAPAILNYPEYEWDVSKYPSFIEGVFADFDEKDNLANEVATVYNGVIENNQLNSPQMEGKRDVRNMDFSGTGFNFDTRKNSYLVDMLFNSGNGALVSLLYGSEIDKIRRMINHKDDSVGKLRLLIYDQYTDLDNRRAVVRGYGEFDRFMTAIGSQFIDQNTLYNDPNTYPSNQWLDDFALPAIDDIQSVFVSPQTWWIPNYPLWFQPKYKYNMATWHKLDQAKFGLRQKRTTEIHLRLCQEVLDALKVWREGSDEITIHYNQGNAYYNDIQIDECLILDSGQPPMIQAYTGYDMSNQYRIIDIQILNSRDIVVLQLKSL